MNTVVTSMHVDEKRLLGNLMLTQGRGMSEAVMIALARQGMDRQEAHELLRKLALKSEAENQGFREILLEDKNVKEKLTEKEIEAALNPRNYLGTAVQQVEVMVKKTRKEHEVKGLT
jgi:adenylosuccinate lyase